MAINENFRICWCPNHKIDDLRTFIDTYWRSNHILARDRDLLVWQYRHLSSPDELSVVVALNEEDRIVGCFGMIQTDFNYYGQRRRGIWLSTWVVTPEVRGKGLGFGMLDMVMKDRNEIIGSMGYNIKAKEVLTRAGFITLDSIPRWVYPIHLPALKLLLDTRDEFWASKTWNALQRITERALPNIESDAIHVLDWDEQLAKKWDHAWEQKFSPQFISNWHDSAFLKWRYIAHPTFQYAVKFAQDSETGNIKGMLSYRIETVQNRDEKILHIVNLLADDDVLPDLVRCVIQVGQENQVAFIDFFCASMQSGQRLESLGFLRHDQAPEIERLPRLFQPLDFRPSPLNLAFWTNGDFPIAAETIFEQEHLYFTRSDCDQDRPN